MPGSQDNGITRSQRSIADIPRVVMNVALREDCINLCHLNAQSLCARQLSKFDEFKNCFLNSKVDIVCVTETWLNENIRDSTVAVDGFCILRNDRKTGRGGGICIYHKLNIDCRIVNASDISPEQVDGERTEYLFVEVKVNNEIFFAWRHLLAPRR